MVRPSLERLKVKLFREDIISSDWNTSHNQKRGRRLGVNDEAVTWCMINQTNCPYFNVDQDFNPSCKSIQLHFPVVAATQLRARYRTYGVRFMWEKANNRFLRYMSRYIRIDRFSGISPRQALGVCAQQSKHGYALTLCVRSVSRPCCCVQSTAVSDTHNT